MKTAQILSLEESFAFGFKHLGLSSHCNMITVNNAMDLSPKFSNYLDSMSSTNVTKVARVGNVMVKDNTVCDTDKTKKVGLTKDFITYEGYNIIVETYFYHHCQFVCYTLKEIDYFNIG